MGTAYTVIVRAKLPKHLVARAVVMRADGAELSADDVAKARALYAPEAASKPTSKATAKPSKATKTAKASKPRAAAAKPKKAPRRAAAKRTTG